MDLDEDTVEEHTRANTRLNTKSNTRKEKVLEQEPLTRKNNGDSNVNFCEEIDEEEEEAMIRANTRMDMRRQKDIADLAGIRCSQLWKLNLLGFSMKMRIDVSSKL